MVYFLIFFSSVNFCVVWSYSFYYTVILIWWKFCNILIFFLLGVTNGIDVCEWNPSSDKHIPFSYSVDDLSGKVVKSFFSNQLFCSVFPLLCFFLNLRFSVRQLYRQNQVFLLGLIVHWYDFSFLDKSANKNKSPHSLLTGVGFCRLDSLGGQTIKKALT